jgi:hypothetical protein
MNRLEPKSQPRQPRQRRHPAGRRARKRRRRVNEKLRFQGKVRAAGLRLQERAASIRGPLFAALVSRPRRRAHFPKGHLMAPYCSSPQLGDDYCAGTAFIKPGETTALAIDWSDWLARMPGQWTLTPIAANSGATPPIVASPAAAVIDLATQLAPAVATDLQVSSLEINGGSLSMLVSAAPGVAIRRMFRLDFTVSARDCAGRVVTGVESVLVIISQGY